MSIGPEIEYPLRSPPANRARPERSRRLLAGAAPCLIILALSLFAGCRAEDPEAAFLREPVISIDASALDRVLAMFERLEATPLAHDSRSLRTELDGRSCRELWLRPSAAGTAHREGDAAQAASISASTSTSPPTLAALEVECGREIDSPPRLAEIVRTRRGSHDALVLWPLGDDGRVELRLDVDVEGGVLIDGTIVPPTDPGALALLLPSAEAPAAPAITPSATLMHWRMRPRDGLRLSSLIPQDSQADRLFALKGRLLEGALLAGTFELALVPPTAQGQVPLLVGALHHRHPEAIRAALSEALDQLEAMWPIQRSPRRFHAGGETIEGGCFLDLPLLPELAPCWTVTETAFLMGWRGEAIESALSPPSVSTGPNTAALPAETHRLDIDFDRVGAIDRLLAPEDDLVRPADVFSKLALRWSATEAGAIRVQARLGARS